MVPKRIVFSTFIRYQSLLSLVYTSLRRWDAREFAPFHTSTPPASPVRQGCPAAPRYRLATEGFQLRFRGLAVKQAANVLHRPTKNLQQTIRLAYVKEGKEELLSLCQEYNDIFRLRGDRLTEVKDLAHTIPTPHINPHKRLTLKNYRLPKAHQDEVQKQVEIMLKQDIIKPSQSPGIFHYQGSQFMSKVFHEICKILKIDKIHTSAYHSESNGSLERAHKVLVEYLRCYCTKKQDEWDKWLPFAVFTYNTTPHSSTKIYPYEVMYGRIANIPGKLQKKAGILYNYDDFVATTFKQRMKITWQEARELLIQSKEHRVQEFNGKQKEIKIKVDMKVYVRKETGKKLDPLWEGPYEVMGLQGVNEELCKIGEQVSIMRMTLHIAMLLGYIGVSEGIRIQNDEISGKAGLYFDHVNDVWFTPYSWDVITYIDLKPVQHLYDTLQKGITRLEQECKAIKDFTWFHKTDCEQGLTDIRSRKFGVQRLKATLDEIIGPNQQRRKRSMSGFVGEIFRILFGTATEAEIETYKRKMDQMQAEQLKFLQLNSDKLTILKSSLISINETVTEVTLNEKEIIKNFETVTNAWGEK
ncbi:hypothetical protein ANN_19098 [Periplaneta americana]|uniref:Integrase catalytic domain-containing protein n=1 Tax=Periplaneta americana TaxID=6978 RepID=A0ABQ8S950_PERAM|nr:hypothetical protein ANN_19098 [Periplaneta americana]